MGKVVVLVWVGVMLFITHEMGPEFYKTGKEMYSALVASTWRDIGGDQLLSSWRLHNQNNGAR